MLCLALLGAPIAQAQEHKVTGFDVPLIPAWGGSGVVSPTAHGILVAEGSSAFSPIVLAAGQVLLGNSSADPSAISLSLGEVVSLGNQVNSVSASGQITWAAAGSYNTSTPEVVGPSNQTMFTVAGGRGSGLSGQTLHVGGGFGNGDSILAAGWAEFFGEGGGGGAGGWELNGGASSSLTNGAGGDCYIYGSQGTGTGTPSLLHFGMAGITASGTSGQTLSDVTILAGAYNNLSGSTPIWNVNPTWADGGTNSTTSANTFQIAAIYNYTGGTKTGKTCDFLINRTETSLPTGTNRFIDCQVSTASKFFVTNAGAATFAGNLTLNGSSSGSTTFSAGATPTATTYTWPSSPTNGNYLTTNGSGTLSWGAVSLPQFAVHATLTSGPNNLDATAVVWPNDCTSGSFTDTLPDATTCSGRIYVIKKTTSANTLTLATTSSQTIDGQTSITFSTQYQGIFIYSDGANWWIIG